MNFKTNLGLMCFALLSCLTTLDAFALSKPQLTLHDLAEQGSSLLVNGNDPFIITSPYSDARRLTHLLLNLQISDIAADRQQLRMELFFKPLAQPTNTSSLTLFDPLYKIQFDVDKDIVSSNNRAFLIKLPKPMEPADLNLIRLDIDGCLGCSISMLSHPKFVAEAPAGLLKVAAYRTLNGSSEVNVDGVGISLDDWSVHDLEKHAAYLEATGTDPYLVSPYLDLTTSNLGGVLVRLKAVSGEPSLMDFQLFYATEAHGFTESASIRQRLPHDGKSNLAFVIPLPFLSEEQPARSLLERIRLDLPGDSNAKWQLLESTILSKQQLKQNRQLIPRQMVSVKLQRATGFALLRNSAAKVLDDLGFVLAYITLLLVISLLFWRAYRK
ncbi:hypothetical protein [Arenicella xantha]|uniref:Cellulose synthase regulatory subunit n=1 Tax=Arenicella xantha TaxID=644221 RepID=A0A395JF93_9GAMM|nr:hypothetical protein [Arenicella xantha]RBP48354.1 hypothetical protein DFR28_10883 [Arenicella xantha]